MTVDELRRGQQEIDELILKRASDNKLLETADGPIYDGVANEYLYLNSKRKVMWLLLEPYDDGNYGGGGWSLVKDVILKPKPSDPSNPTQQTTAYAMWCARNRCAFFNALDAETVYPELQSIAWVNISKMPATSRSKPPEVIRKYKQNWKDIIDRQISLLAPNVVIIAGKQFNAICGKGLFDGDNGCECCFPNNRDSLVDLHRCTNFDVLYSDHPAYWKNPFHKRWRPTLSQETYIDAIAEALHFLGV